LHVPKPLRHASIIITRVVDNYRQKEGLVAGHQMAPIHRELPLETEIPLVAVVSVAGDDGEE
jgi:hypothetical protein